MSSVYVRINGNAAAFSREPGCDCGRCRSVGQAPSVPPAGLRPFAGWSDPPLRAHTSASIFIPTMDNSTVASHILIDCGAGVVDSFCSSGVTGLENLDGVVISHWHPDHGQINQLCEGIRRVWKAKGLTEGRLRLFCTRETYDRLAARFPYEAQSLDFCEIKEGESFRLSSASPIEFLPLGVAHGLGGGRCAEAVILVASVVGSDRRAIFGWDIDLPNAERSLDGKCNIDVFRENRSILRGARLYFVPLNTWSARGTGHTSREEAQAYMDEVCAERVLAVHMSGHEDGPGHTGYGWNDGDWATHLAPAGIEVARQGMLVEV